METAKEDGAAENGPETEDDRQDAEKEVLPSEQASFLDTLGLQHISQVSSGNQTMYMWYKIQCCSSVKNARLFSDGSVLHFSGEVFSHR